MKKNFYGLLSREALRKCIDASIPKCAMRLYWHHCMNAKSGHTLKSLPHKEIADEIGVSMRNFWYSTDALKDAKLLFHDRHQHTFTAFAPDLHTCVHLAEKMRSEDYNEPQNPLGGMAYGTLPRKAYESAITGNFSIPALRIFWYLSLNSFDGSHTYIEFEDIRKAVGISLSGLWRGIGQMQDAEIYKIQQITGGFSGSIPAIPESRQQAKERRVYKEQIKTFIDAENQECKKKLNRSLTKEERKTFIQFAEDRIDEGYNLNELKHGLI